MFPLNNRNIFSLLPLLFSFVGCEPATESAVRCMDGQVATQLGCVDVDRDGGVSPALRPEMPVAVDNWYAASGYMGDAVNSVTTTSECPKGSNPCHQFVYELPSVSEGFGGVFWQYPARWVTPQDIHIQCIFMMFSSSSSSSSSWEPPTTSWMSPSHRLLLHLLPHPRPRPRRRLR